MPKIISEPQSTVVDLGTTIRLPCMVDQNSGKPLHIIPIRLLIIGCIGRFCIAPFSSHRIYRKKVGGVVTAIQGTHNGGEGVGKEFGSRDLFKCIIYW